MPQIIGITSYGEGEVPTNSTSYDVHYAIPAEYVASVRRAGGVPVILPPGEENLSAWLDIFDGIVFSGGADIAPTYYGGDPNHPELGPPNHERDKTEFALLALALERKSLPILLICRGLQLLNVAMGGSLHEHIADVHPENIHQGKTSFWTMQKHSINKDTGLSEIVQQAEQLGQSGHHQGVKALGKNLVVSAQANDNIIEAVEHTKHPFCLGVQWHPEATSASDPSQQKIFDALIEASLNNAAK